VEVANVNGSKWNSRKFKAAVGLTILLTALFIFPPMITLALALLESPVRFELLPVGYFIPTLTMIWGAYFGANAAVHWAYRDKSKGAHPLEIEDLTGGEPPESTNL
jgi:hypothetical protein